MRYSNEITNDLPKNGEFCDNESPILENFAILNENLVMLPEL